ncbi:Uncharacterised protein [Kluyvera cryocrescens]|uniref:Uncharacterized protein n=1 Tax=Kluyvera cryocrescens TaxID=580 RepID=A0A485D3U7_KLUCR|nr:Uncharacterised protein [Kluyvera cryocrescens]
MALKNGGQLKGWPTLHHLKLVSGGGYIDGEFIAPPPPFDYSETEENPKDERDIEEFTPSAVQTQ